MSARSVRAASTTFVLTAALASGGCGKVHSVLAPTGVESSRMLTNEATRSPVLSAVLRPSLENLWPNEDGRSWEYSMVQHVVQLTPRVYYQSPELVPPVTLDIAEDLLRRQGPARVVLWENRYPYRLTFSGEVTTTAGVVAQNLVETSWDATGTRLASASPTTSFLRDLALARPDLRAAIGRVAPAALRSSVEPHPHFLFGSYWKKTTAWVGAYGDADPALAWKYLDADLTKGHEFRFPLLPSMSPGIVLSARVMGTKAVRLPSGRFRRAVEVLYLIDIGINQAGDEFGNYFGYQRLFDYGTVLYVPGVGPVRDVEYRMAQAGNPPAPYLWSLTLDLTEVSPGGKPPI